MEQVQERRVMGKTVAIIGGGVGGLAAAASFAEAGWSTTVYERNEKMRANGNGFPIFPNGARVLRALASDDALQNYGWGLREWVIRSSAGEDINTLDVDSTLGPSGLTMFKRQNLIDLLASAALKHGAVFEDSRTLSYIDRGTKAIFEDGAEVEADLIVGADGVFSRTRRSIFPDLELRAHRKGAVRTLIPYQAEDFGQSVLRQGFEFNDPSGRRLGLYPVSENQLYLLLVFLRDDEEVQRLPVDPVPWSDTFVGMKEFIHRINGDAHRDFYHSVEPPRWSDGKVAIVGDAAHGMTPALGQGANTSLMTAYALGKFVAQADEVTTGLRRWENTMRPIVGFVQRFAEGMTAGRFDPRNDMFFTEPVVGPLLDADVPGFFD
jgi:2-polyprenyl-6-methoxyphenol hydroxylase-like FAD-dependent oxidoreductase